MNHQSENCGQTINIRGVNRPYLERRRILRRDYFLLERIGSPFRESYSAFDPLSGPGGNYFLIQSLPGNKTTEQFLRVSRRLKTDSFPKVVEWQRQGDRFHVASTWTEGITLLEYLEHMRAGRRPAIDPGQAVRLTLGLAHALVHLHRHSQVTHGDIQPTNLIVSSHPARLRLIDFGSAWTNDWTTRRTEGDGHHRCYAAPELQCSTAPVGPACDRFSLSVVLFELLTLELPYGGLGGKAGRPEFISQAERSLVPPSHVSKGCQNLPRSLRDKLDALALQGLAFDPEKRFSNHDEWLNDWQDLSIRFRLKPELSGAESWLTGVIEWACQFPSKFKSG